MCEKKQIKIKQKFNDRTVKKEENESFKFMQWYKEIPYFCWIKEHYSMLCMLKDFSYKKV